MATTIPDEYDVEIGKVIAKGAFSTIRRVNGLHLSKNKMRNFCCTPKTWIFQRFLSKSSSFFSLPFLFEHEKILPPEKGVES